MRQADGQTQWRQGRVLGMHRVSGLQNNTSGSGWKAWPAHQPIPGPLDPWKDRGELPDLLGRSTHELKRELGAAYERELVHRDDLIVL